MPPQIPLPVPSAHRELSRRKRLVIELAVGVAILALISIGVSVQMPHWLEIAGWVLWAAWVVILSVLYVRYEQRKRRRQQQRGQ